MSNPITYSKPITLVFCVALLSLCNSFATAQDLQWSQGLEQARAEAAATNRLVWLHFSADWCVPCKRLETFVFKDSGVVRSADRNTVAVNVNVDQNDSLVKKLGVPRIPYDIVMTPGGEMIVNRASPRDSSGYLKMFNDLDIPLQNLNSGDREVINAGISQLQSIIKKTGSGPPKKGVLDLEGPSHKMAATTVEGQRIERGVSSASRAAEVRAVKAKLLKQKAETYIAQQEQRFSVSKGPKISDNPFFKNSGSQAAPAIVKDAEKFVSNRFVENKDKPAQANPVANSNQFFPPAPPAFANSIATQVQRKAAEASNGLEESQDFSFPILTDAKDLALPTKPNQSASQPVKPNVALPTFAAPQLGALKQSRPKVPEFRNNSNSKSDNDFAYVPLGGLKQALVTAKQPGVVQPKQPEVAQTKRPVAKQWANPVVNQRPAVNKVVVVPQAPVMVQGVVRKTRAAVHEIEGHLVAAEQPRRNSNNFSTGNQQSARVVSRADDMLKQVNFFGAVDPVDHAPKVTIVQAPPAAPQPQIVINLNAGSVANPQPTQARNYGRFVQQGSVNAVAQPKGNQAPTKGLDVASQALSKFALKGKCPVTLLTKGQWVDGQKEIGCVHRDRVYLFASAANRETFLANPDQMSPLLAGFDPVIFEETGKLVEGDERHGTFMGEAPNQRIVLFKTSDTRDRFQKQPVKYLDIVRNAMTKNATSGTKLR